MVFSYLICDYFVIILKKAGTMIKNVLSSDEANDVLRGITGDNYYVFKGEYGSDTVKTKGDKNTLQFDNGTQYYFTAKGNNLVMHTDTNAQEVEEHFYYNGEFTDEEYSEVENISVKDMYIVDGELSETGTEDQRIGDKCLVKVSDGIVDGLYVDDYDGLVHKTDYGFSSGYVALDPSTPLYVDEYGLVTINNTGDSISNYDKFYVHKGFSSSDKEDVNIYDIIHVGSDAGALAESVEFELIDPNHAKYITLDSDMYYNPETGEFTTEPTRVTSYTSPVEGAIHLSECYISDGYISTSSGYGELIGNRTVYLDKKLDFENKVEGYKEGYDISSGINLGFSVVQGSNSYAITNPEEIFISIPEGSGWVDCLFVAGEGVTEDNTLVTELENAISEQYWQNGLFTNDSTHQVQNKHLSELYLVDGQIKESGDPSQLIGDKTLYEYEGKYYTETFNTGSGTITISNFLKGKTDVKVDIGDTTGLTLADLVNESYIQYDKSDAVKKQTIKAHTKWNSKVIGSDFNDKIYGSYYNDKLYGGEGNDTIYTRTGDDMVEGGNGNDKIYLNGKGTKTVDAGSGDDRIYLTAKNVSADITGGEGNDRIYIKKSVLENSVLNFKGGSGNDTVSVSSKVDVSNLTLNIENFDAETSKFTKSGNNLIITSGEDSVTLTNYFKKGYYVSSAVLKDKTLAEWVNDSELYISSNSKTTKGTNFDDVIDAGAKVKKVLAYGGDDVICSSYQKMTVDGGEGTDTYNFQTDNLTDFTILFNVKKESGETEGDSVVGNALYVVSNDSTKLSNGVTLKNVENVQVNGSDYALTDEIIANVQSWLSTANKGQAYDSVADAIAGKCNVQDLIAAFTPNEPVVQ